MVGYAITIAQSGPRRIPAHSRIASYSVWDAVVFALNILAFIFIGLQIRPILEKLPVTERGSYVSVALAVLATVIGVRFVWQMTFNACARLWHARRGFHPRRPTLQPTVQSGLVISWAGMRGIVTLAAAMALPLNFPQRNLIMLTAFSVVLGTLVLQGLTLKPLLRWLKLRDGDPVGKESRLARERALRSALGTFNGDRSPAADLVRRELTAYLADETTFDTDESTRSAHHELRAKALSTARETVLAMRSNQEIGDDAFHQIEEALDRLEFARADSGE